MTSRSRFAPFLARRLEDVRLLLAAAAATAALSGSALADLANCASSMRGPVTITVNPGQSIQKALDKAQPGTVIRVKAGTYKGSISLSKLRGTAAKPILLISADGPGKAVIAGSSNKAAVNSWGGRYFGMYGFRVVANASSGDVGGFKIGGEWDNPPHDLVFSGNTIAGKGQDGFKLFAGAYNVTFVGNVIDGQWRQEVIDNVSVEDVTYAYNTIKGKAGVSAITIKAGSRNVEVVRNSVNPSTDFGIMIGGYGSSRLDRSFPSYWRGFEAEDVTASGNIVGTNVRRHSAVFVGARYSTLAANQLPRTVGSKAHREAGHFNYHSHHNTIRDNFVTSSRFFQPDGGEDVGYNLKGNTIGKAKKAAGVAAFNNNTLGVCPGDYADGLPSS